MDDMQKRLQTLEDDVKNLIDTYKNVAEMLVVVQFLQQQILNLNKRIDDNCKTTERQLTILDNKFAYSQQSLDDKYSQRLDILDEQFGTLAFTISMKSSKNKKKK